MPFEEAQRHPPLPRGSFLVEKSLSVDNLFVFLMLFQYFKVPERHTQRVLTWGIFSALVLRGIMIAVGVAAVQRFRWVLLIFALVLVFSAYKVSVRRPERGTCGRVQAARSIRAGQEATRDGRWSGGHRSATVGHGVDYCAHTVLADALDRAAPSRRCLARRTTPTT